MKRLAVLCLLLVLVSIPFVAPVNAQATVTEVVQSCSSFSAKGFTDQPFITVEIWSWTDDVSQAYVDHVFVTVPVNPDGSFNYFTTFAPQPGGTRINYWLWASPENNINSWDGEAWYESGEIACVPAVTNCPIPRPAAYTVRSIPAGALTFSAADASTYTGFNLPAGQSWYTAATAENGYIKVWIACQASMVYVPESNVLAG